jgi:transcriptional regulator with XRE-family HTH domain
MKEEHQEQSVSTIEVPRTQIAIRLQSAMDNENLSLQDLAKEFDMTYEYMRRLARGLTLPSKTVLKLMSQRFKWDYQGVETELVQDRFRAANGPKGAIAQILNPEVEPFEKAWHLLEEPQKQILRAQFDMFLTQNRRHIRGGVKPTEGGKKK